MSKLTIIEKALELFAAKGYEGTSMEHIASAVGIKKASIYSHYAGKEQIFSAVFEHVLQEYRAFIYELTEMKPAHSAINRLKDVFYQYIHNCTNNLKMDFWDRFYYYPPEYMREEMVERTKQIETILIQRITAIIGRGIEQGHIVTQPEEDIARTFYFLMIGIAMSTSFYGVGQLEKEMDRCIGIFTQGIRVR